MSGPFTVITSTGIATRLAWWNTLTVDGHLLMLVNMSTSEDRREPALIVAELGSEEEARVMLGAVMKCVGYGVRYFDARLYSSGQ